MRYKKGMRWWTAFAAGCWMLGEGLRMAVMGVFFAGQGWSYFPNHFDVLFDWVPLIILGSLFLILSLEDFYTNIMASKNDH